MSTMDAHGNNHHGAGTPAGGQFAEKANTAPSGSLTDIERVADRDAFMRQRANAASLYRSARNTYIQANRDAAAVVLQEQFPWATTAVFTRAWDDPEERIVLAQLRSEDRTLDLESEEDAGELTTEQHRALADSRSWVAEMGEEVFAYVEEPDEQHEGWYQYDLDLSAALVPQDASGYIVDQLDEREREHLNSQLADRDGRMAPMVSTLEIEYQLAEGDIAQVNPELAEALNAEYGNAANAAKAIADSPSWFSFRESVANELHERINPAIADAAKSLLKGES